MMTVLRLVAGLPRHKNFKLFFDNWFASEELIIELLKMGFHSIATVRTNRFKINFKPEKKVFEKGERASYDIYIYTNFMRILYAFVGLTTNRCI